MADRIHIRDLHLRTVIGINEEKRRDKQDVLINLVLDTDTRAAGRSDDVADTLNYRTLTKRIIELVENSEFCLVEKLAAEIARLGVQPVKWQVSARQVCAPATLG
jgi:FolB domain-containing protein